MKKLILLSTLVLVLGFTLAWGASPDSRVADIAYPKLAAQPLTRGVVLSEDFESTTFPPGNWTTINNNVMPESNWHRAQNIEETSFVADIEYSDGLMMDEWLISPAMNLAGMSDINLSFNFMMSYYWMVDPYDGADLFVKVSTDGGTTWSTPIWEEADFGLFENWEWGNVQLPLSAYAGQPNVKFAFHYYGDDGAQVQLDDIVVTATMPGYPTAASNPTPADGTLGVSINAGTLSWTFGTDTETYDLLFGPTGDMQPLVTGAAAGTTGSQTYPALQYRSDYSWQVISHNSQTRFTTPGPVWSFTTEPDPNVTEIIIGNGTAVQRFPLGSWYGYERSAALYTAAEIGAQNTRISAVSWYSNTMTDKTIPTKIYMKTTTAGTLTTDNWTNMIAGATLLYDRAQTGTVAAGWNLITLDNTFDVDQGDNLLILVERNTGGGGDGGSAGAGINSTALAGTHLTWQADTNPPTTNGTTAANRPNVTLAYSTYTITTGPNPAIVNSPADAATEVPTYATLNWGSGGGAPTGYYLYFGTADAPTSIENGTDLGNVFTYNPANLAYSTTYHWQVVPYNGNGSAIGCPTWTFTTMDDPAQYTLPWTEGFETDNTNEVAVSGWTQEGIEGTNAWTANNTEINYNRLPRTGDWNAYLRYGNTRWMFKPVHFEAGVAYQAIVYARQDGAGATNASIGISYGLEPSAAGMTQTILAPTGIIDGDYQALQGFFTPATTGTYYVGILGTINFSPWYISIDDITIQEAPGGLPNPVTLISPINGARNIPLEGFTLSWAPDLTGGAPTSYKVYLDTNVNPGTLYATESGISYEVVTPLAPGTTYYWKVIAHNGDGDSADSAVFSFETVPEGLVVIGDGVANLNMPIKPYFNYSYSQSIFLQSEIAMADKRIESVYYYWNGVAEATASNDWTIYMGHTDLAEFASTTSWIPLDELSQVFQGNVALPAVAGWIEIPITPFTYNNTDNLVIAVDENSASCDGSSEFFLCTGAATNRGIRHYSDSVNADPAAPPVGTLQLGYPNVMLQLGDLPSGPPSPVTMVYPSDGAEGLPIEGFDLTWTPTYTGGLPDYYILNVASSAEGIYDEESFDNLTGTSFNPVVDGGMTFNYNDRWFWMVVAVNEHDAAESDIHFFDIIAAPAQISVTPTSLTETLEFGSTSVQTLTINNAGGLPLDYAIGFEDTTVRSQYTSVIGNIISSASAALYAERNPLPSNESIDASRAQFDLQFAFTGVGGGEYGVASDGEYIYTSKWNSPAGALVIHKYALDGTDLGDITINGVDGLRDLTYDGTYFYGAAASTTIYQMDFNAGTLIGTIPAPVSVRAIAYDSDNDAFWVSNNWADPLNLVARDGTVLRTLDTQAADFAGMAYDNLSGVPSLWVNSQSGTPLNTLVQVSLDDGSVLQSFHVNDTVIPGLTDDDSAGGVEIVTGLVPGTATILATAQNTVIYGLELCDVATWAKAVPRSGTVAPGGTAIVDIEFDATETAPGVHTGLLTISHNAPTAAVEVPVTLTITGEWPAAFAIDPATWAYGDVEQLNSLTKQFTITNTGGPFLNLNAGDITISNDAEGNFFLNATGLPVALEHNGTYNFTVDFIPQTLGAKSAVLNIQDNITRVVQTVALSGNGIAELMDQEVVNLTADVQNRNNVLLNWGMASSTPGEPGWLHYDDGTNASNVGTGAAGTFNVAVKFTGADLWNYSGMQLEKIKFYPHSATTDYTLKIWTGSDASLAPTTLMYSQAVVAPTLDAMNEIPLTTPFLLTQGQAVWFGYECVVAASAEDEDYYPAGAGPGPAVVGKGDVIELGGTWYSMATQYGIDNNWNLQGYVNDVRGLALAAQWLNIPVTNREASKETLRNLRLSTSGNPAPAQRALRGFNIYRNGAPINTEIVAAYSYLDEELAAGIYNYAVQPVYYSANGLMSDVVSVEILPPPPPIALPFTETWDIDFETNMWTPGGANWGIYATAGAPAPSARFYWSPSLTDYSVPLTSYNFDATGIDNVQFSFDLYLDNYSLDAENVMTWEIWDGTIWNTLGSYSSLDDDLGWTRFAYDVSAYASDRIFKIRFVASGENTFEINAWYLDNVHVAELPLSVAPVTDLSIAQAGTNVVLSWTAITGADWYYIYTSEDPYGTFAPLGYIDTAGVSLPASLLPADKAFVKVTAGAGPFPRGERLDNAPAAKRK